jgi:hypothetical protein
MKILFITPSPPNNLNRIRSKNIIFALSELGHKITLVSLYKNKKEFEWLKESEKYVENCHGIHHSVLLSLFFCIPGVFLPVPLRVAFCYSPKLKKFLKKMNLDDYDLIYIKRLRMSQYAKIFSGKRIFIDITDSMTKYYDRLKGVSKGIWKILSYEEYFKHSIYESNKCKVFNNIVVCSEEDKKYLINKLNCPEKNIKVLENGLNLDQWKISLHDARNDMNRLVFLGVMNVDTNSLSVKFFIDKVFSSLSNEYTFTVIGPKPGKMAKEYRERIKFLGYVNDIQKALGNFDVFVCPIIAGAGVKNKILQAALSGLLIVTTEFGIEGIDNELKKFVIIAKDAKDFADKIYLIKDMTKLDISEKLKLQADFVKKRYDILELVRNFTDQNF